MRRYLRWLIPAAALPVLGLLAYGFRVNPRDIPTPLIDRPAAAFALTSYAGEPVSLDAYRGRVVVVNFWASWCLGCKQVAPSLNAAERYWSKRGVEFVGVNVQDFRGAANRFLARHDVRYTILRDGQGSSLGHWGVTGLPETFFVDRRGRVVPPHVLAAATRAQINAGVRRALAS